MSKPTIYLAGPISGCNQDQLRSWRNDLKRGFGEEFEFIDPTENLISSDGSDYDVVKADEGAIRSADAVLANMWRESIGTAIGVVHAHSVGKIVVVCDPNLIRSRLLAFYSDAVEVNLPHALNAIRTFLRVQRLVTAVSKADGAEEPFDRRKLTYSVRGACVQARQSDIVPARAIVAKSLELLFDDATDERVLTTTEIRDSVWEAIAELSADPLHQADYEAIRRAWERHAEAKTGKVLAPSIVEAPVVPAMIHDKPLEVKLRSQHQHSTIWGNSVGSQAMRIFDEIKRVEGITEIVFRQFSNTGSPPSKPHVRVQASKQAHIIEGKCYDNGKKGTLQTFQIRVANPAQRDAVLLALREHLTSAGHIRAIVFSE